MRKNLFGSVFIILIFFSAMFGAIIGANLVMYKFQSDFLTPGKISEQTQGEPEINENTKISPNDINRAFTDVVDLVEPSVVTVVGEIEERESLIRPLDSQQIRGSGFILSKEGYIITNNHVIEDVDSINVILNDGSKVAVEVLGRDVFSDLAVLKSNKSFSSSLILGDSDNLKSGELIIAIGSPLGNFRNSVTTGVISATHRSIDRGDGYILENLLQTDAAINKGNSGGPLVNLFGEVVGINSLIIRESSNATIAEGLGFAIPSNDVKIITDEIILKGSYSRPKLGVTVKQVDPSAAIRFNLSAEWGAFISEIEPGTPADLAGLQIGDIITRIGQDNIDENQRFLNTLFKYNPGDLVEIEVIRDSKKRILQVVLGELILWIGNWKKKQPIL